MILSGFCHGHPTCWEELPVELLLMIMNNLDDKSSKLRCRLVNSKWRAAVNSSLERETLSSWTSRTFFEESVFEPPFPKMRILNYLDYRGLLTSNFLNCPLDFAKTLGNPFPSKSLCISPQNRWGYRKSNRKSRVKMFKVFTLFGSHLTSFHLHGVKVTGALMNLVLKLLENLRALTLSSIRIDEDSLNLSGRLLVVSPPPNLQYLRLININDSDFIQFFVDLCSYQLVSLEVDGFNLRPLRQPMFNFTGITGKSTKSLKLNNVQTAWKNLCKLKVSVVNIEFLQKTISAPIQHLYIGGSPLDEKVCLTDLIKLLEKFSTTLVTLYINIKFGNSDIMEHKIVSNSITFPCLKKIHVCYLESNNYKILLAYENNILSKCPKLEHIHWLYQSHRTFGDLHDLKKKFKFVFHSNCWQICPTLRYIVVSGKKLGYHQPFEVKYTREMFYIWEFEQVLAKLNMSQKKSSIIIYEDNTQISSLTDYPEN
ncbi:unnamed protein product [Orchesella dallaii]|uniref:F-box domain-containing protein n=1 Tax=Orchesella dallaii TaxID=48710 RepID=A0ABP1RQU3_9HEXA